MRGLEPLMKNETLILSAHDLTKPRWIYVKDDFI